MKTKKYLRKIVPVLVATLSLCACNDDDNVVHVIDPVLTPPGAYVLNQGNYYNSLAGSIGYLDYATKTMTDSVFYASNGILPGNTLQYGMVYGSHFYAIAYESNVLFVCDLNMKMQKMVTISAPRALAAEGGYVYISNYDGHVTKLDTLSMTIVSSVSVGPNPEEMAVANGYIYVVNSDGLNYQNNYANGKSVSKIRLSDFSVVKTISVGLNPTKAVADEEGNVFVIAMGDYSSEPSVIQKIDKEDQVTSVAEASMMTINKDTLYAVKSATSDWVTYQNTYFIVNTNTLAVTDNYITDGVEVPIAIAVDPINSHIFVTSHTLGVYGANYSSAGYMKEYDAKGNYLNTYATGVNPVQVVFRYK